MGRYFVKSNCNERHKAVGGDEKSLIDLFYSTVQDFNNDNNNTNDREFFMIPVNDGFNVDYEENKEEENEEQYDCLTDNAGLTNYLEINACERRYNLYQKKKVLFDEKIRREAPQIISNYGLVRLFEATNCENTYGIVMKMIANGLVKQALLPQMAHFPHPVVNYSTFQFFDSALYERYIVSMMLPTTYRQNLIELTLNPRYAFMAYIISFVEHLDGIFYFDNVKTTFKAVLLTILNSNHINKSKTIGELTTPLDYIIDPRNNPHHSDFIARLLRISVYALYLLAMNKVLGGDLSVKRVDAAAESMYICNKTKKFELCFHHKNTMYYAARNDLWLFRLNEKEGDVYYSNDMTGVIFPRKTSIFPV